MSLAVGHTSDKPPANPDNYKRNSPATVESPLPAKGRGRWTGVSWRRGVAVCLLYTLAAIYFTWPLVPRLQTHTVAHMDPPFSAWRLAWVSRQLVRDSNNLFDTNIFWPAQRTLAYSDAMLVQGTLALPLIRGGVPPLVVMNAFTVLGMIASAAGAYLLAKRLSGHTGGAILAGIVFAFAPYRHDHIAHLELQWAQWMPLAFWAWHRALDRGRFRDGVLCGLFLLLQLLSSIYYALFLITTLAVLGVVTLAARRFRIAPAALVGLAVGATILGVGASEYSRPYRRAQQRVGERHSGEARRYSGMYSSFLSTRPDNRLYGGMTGNWHEEEKRLFPGITPVVLAGAALAPPLSATVVAWGVATLFSMDAATGMHGHVFPELRRWVSTFRGLRAPARYGALVQLGLGVLAAFGLARLARRWPRHATLVTAGCMALVTIEYSVKPVPLMPMPIAPPKLYRWLAAAQPPGTIVLELPVPHPAAMPFEDPMYMYASTWHWHSLVNGYSGHYYPPYVSLLESMKSFPQARALEHMTRYGVQLVIVHKILFPKGRYEKLVEQLDANPMFHLLNIADDWGGEARAYAFLPGYGPKESDE